MPEQIGSRRAVLKKRLAALPGLDLGFLIILLLLLCYGLIMLF